MTKAHKAAVLMALGAFLLAPAVAQASQAYQRTLLERVEALEKELAGLRVELAEERFRSSALANMVGFNRAVIYNYLKEVHGVSMADEFTAMHIEQMVPYCLTLKSLARELLVEGTIELCLSFPEPDV